MDKYDWWRTPRCAGSAQDKMVVDHLMLRYRPIAPKPVTADLLTGQPRVGNRSLYVASRRTKRKYVKVSKNYSRSKNRSKSSDRENAIKKVVTLQLLPEKTDNLERKDESTPSSLDNLDRAVDTIARDNGETLEWIKLNGHNLADQMVGIQQRKVVESLVTVELVTGACGINGGSHALGCTDVEIMDNLVKDTCPGFISDGWNCVIWLNEAYRRMVDGSDGGESQETLVRLVMKETVSLNLYRAFTCRVRLQYPSQKVKYSRTVPCDVWKMGFGGFAWRLDTEAALSLGLRH